MKYIKSFNSIKRLKKFESINLNYDKFDDIMESMNVWYDTLLSAISAEEVDVYEVFKLPIEVKILDLSYLKDNKQFINSIIKAGFKISEINNSDDFETFLNKPCKFMFIYNASKHELENPDYLFLQIWNESLKTWSDVKLYKVNDDVRRFYEKLTSKTIEIIDGDKNYIYETSNGNEWILQNLEEENDTYKKVFRREEIRDLINKNKQINIRIL